MIREIDQHHKPLSTQICSVWMIQAQCTHLVHNFNEWMIQVLCIHLGHRFNAWMLQAPCIHLGPRSKDFKEMVIPNLMTRVNFKELMMAMTNFQP